MVLDVNCNPQNVTKRIRKYKNLNILLVILLTIYPVVELSRVIVLYNVIGWQASNGIPREAFILELALIWVFYIALPFVLNSSFNTIWKLGRREKVLEQFRDKV